MSKLQIVVTNALALLMFVLAAIMLFTIFTWAYPREIIKIELTTDRESYQVEDKIVLLTSVIEGRAEADSDYETTLDCKEVRFPIAQFSAITQVSPPRTSQVPIDIPQDIRKTLTCRIEAEGRHVVNILPGVNKTYNTVWYSNEFTIVKGE